MNHYTRQGKKAGKKAGLGDAADVEKILMGIITRTTGCFESNGDDRYVQATVAHDLLLCTALARGTSDLVGVGSVAVARGGGVGDGDVQELRLVGAERLENDVSSARVVRLVAQWDFATDSSSVGIHVQALEFVGEGVADEVVAMGQETSAQTDAVERVGQFVGNVLATHAGAGIAGQRVVREGVKEAAKAQGLEELFRPESIMTIILSRSGG